MKNIQSKIAFTEEKIMKRPLAHRLWPTVSIVWLKIEKNVWAPIHDQLKVLKPLSYEKAIEKNQ